MNTKSFCGINYWRKIVERQDIKMFIYSFKANKKALIGAGMVILALLILFFAVPRQAKSVAAQLKPSLKAQSNEERIAFIANFGYDVIKEPVEIRDITIPEQFDDTYSSYNELQLSQGFDLSKYKGKNAKSYSYAVTNYDAVENSEQTIRVNLIVYRSRIIAADICSVELDGFMHALSDGKTG